MKKPYAILSVIVVASVVGYLTVGKARGNSNHSPLVAFTNTIKVFQNTLNSIQKSLNDLAKAVNSSSSNGKNVAAPWSQSLPLADRFQMVLGGAGVLDNETLLVWEQSPEMVIQDWVSAQMSCTQKTVGNRKGWRVPTVQELASLIDPTKANPALPSGHPFSNVQLSGYWSATTAAMNTSFAWAVGLNDGGVGFVDKDDSRLAWCVRGGQGVDPQ
jgi:Protein of unknown function (DUF1566)